MDHARGLVFRRPQAASHRRSVAYFCSAVLSVALKVKARAQAFVRCLVTTGKSSLSNEDNREQNHEIADVEGGEGKHDAVCDEVSKPFEHR